MAWQGISFRSKFCISWGDLFSGQTLLQTDKKLAIRKRGSPATLSPVLPMSSNSSECSRTAPTTCGFRAWKGDCPVAEGTARRTKQD